MEIFKAYVRHGKAGQPMRDEKVAYRQTEAPKNPSRTGYGSKLPTEHSVHFNGRWRRVYAICHSNVSTFYIIDNTSPSKEKLIVSFY